MTTTPEAPLVDESPWSSAPLPPAVRRRPGRVLTAPRVLLALAAVVLALSLPGITTATETVYGLLAAAPGLAVAVVLAALGFCLAVRRGETGDAIAAVVVYILCFRLPVALGASVPIGAWTYKHFGVIDYIMTHGAVAPGVDVYNSWPGVFSALAWFSSVTGVSPLDVGLWFPVVVHLFIAAGVFALGRAFGLTVSAALVASVIGETVNWVGQDYLSPQAVAFVLAIVCLALLVRSRQRPLLGWLAVPLFAAITVSHQLTPYWVIGVAIVLGVTGHIRPRYLGAVFAAIAGGYLVLNFGSLGAYSLFSGFNPVANAKLNVNGAGSAGLQFTGIAIKVTTIALWGGAAVAAGRLVWRARGERTRSWRVLARRVPPDAWLGLVLAFSPFALLAAQNYGGEAIFRVFLYSIPGCAVLTAPLLDRVLRRSIHPVRNGLAVGAGGLVVVILTLTSLQSYYGGWFTLLVRPDAIATVDTVLRTADPSALVIGAAPVAPNRGVAEYIDFARYDRSFDESLSIRPGFTGEDFTSTGLTDRFTAEMLQSGRPVFVLVTAQMRNYSDYYGLYPAGALDRLVGQLEVNPAWEATVDTPTVHLFELRRTG